MSKMVAVTEHDQQQGSPDAEVTLVEYGDYQCPSCGDAYTLVKKVQKHFGKKLTFVFRNFPLDQHEFAEAAAETALFAAAHGKFWEMHDLLYKRQRDFSEDLFPELATELGLDDKALAKALKTGHYKASVKAELEGGIKSGVEATPTFFFNGKQDLDANDFDSMVAALEANKS